MVDKVRKHFVRIVTENEISRDDAMMLSRLHDVVQSVEINQGVFFILTAVVTELKQRLYTMNQTMSKCMKY